MSSAGHVQDMIQRQRHNRAALKSKQAKFKERKLRNIQYKGSGMTVPDPDISREEMEEIKREIRAEARAYKQKKFLQVFLIVSTVLAVLTYVLCYYLFSVFSV
ncbi:MAG: hypothetical protein AB8B53_07065 [Flavobacteriales bacterium]